MKILPFVLLFGQLFAFECHQFLQKRATKKVDIDLNALPFNLNELPQEAVRTSIPTDTQNHQNSHSAFQANPSRQDMPIRTSIQPSASHASPNCGPQSKVPCCPECEHWSTLTAYQRKMASAKASYYRNVGFKRMLAQNTSSFLFSRRFDLNAIDHPVFSFFDS